MARRCSAYQRATWSAACLAADSSGIACDRNKRTLVRALRVIEVEEHVKFHAMTELHHGLTTIACARVSSGEAHDAPFAEEMVSRGELGEGKRLADSAYDSEQIFKACFEKGLMPVVKLRKNS